ncbi:MAG: Uma2 family endonuclease [Caldilineaceae bacterium]
MTVAVKEVVVERNQILDWHYTVGAERPLHRFTLEEYHWLIEQGFFQPDDRVELIEGVLVDMSPLHPPHADTVASLTEELVTKVKRRAKVRIQQPITLPEQITEPEPDFVLALRTEEYRTKHPLPADVLLVGEVSDSTLAYDRGKRARLYAEAGIQEYWIVNLVDNVLEVYRDPLGSGSNAGYQTKLIYPPDAKIAPLALPNCRLELTTIFFGTVDGMSPDIEE